MEQSLTRVNEPALREYERQLLGKVVFVQIFDTPSRKSTPWYSTRLFSRSRIVVERRTTRESGSMKTDRAIIMLQVYETNCR